MSELDQMNEIVGESGTAGKPGCGMTVAVAGLAILTGLGLMVSPAAAAGLVPRKPVCLPTGVPDVVGMLATDAGNVLTDAGFRYHVNLVKGEVDLFHVESTLPTAGTVVNPCSTVVEIWRGR